MDENDLFPDFFQNNNKQRLIKLGESPKKIFNFGYTGVENFLNAKMRTKNYLFKKYNKQCILAFLNVLMLVKKFFSFNKKAKIKFINFFSYVR
jgi:hypothetical protein